MHESMNGIDCGLGAHKVALIELNGLAEPRRSEELYRYLLEHRGGPYDSGIRDYVRERVDFRLVLNVSTSHSLEAVGASS